MDGGQRRLLLDHPDDARHPGSEYLSQGLPPGNRGFPVCDPHRRVRRAAVPGGPGHRQLVVLGLCRGPRHHPRSDCAQKEPRGRGRGSCPIRACEHLPGPDCRRPQHDQHRHRRRRRRHHRRRGRLDRPQQRHRRRRRGDLGRQRVHPPRPDRGVVPDPWHGAADDRQLHRRRVAAGGRAGRAGHRLRARPAADRGPPLRLLLRHPRRRYAAGLPRGLRRRGDIARPTPSRPGSRDSCTTSAPRSCRSYSSSTRSCCWTASRASGTA